MNKPIGLEYYVDKSAEIDLRSKFYKPFDNHKLPKFIGSNKKFNPDLVKAFYCKLEQTPGGIESRFKDRVVKFNYLDFNTYFNLKLEGPSIDVARSPEYDRTSFVNLFPSLFLINLAWRTFI